MATLSRLPSGYKTVSVIFVASGTVISFLLVAYGQLEPQAFAQTFRQNISHLMGLFFCLLMTFIWQGRPRKYLTLAALLFLAALAIELPPSLDLDNGESIKLGDFIFTGAASFLMCLGMLSTFIAWFRSTP